MLLVGCDPIVMKLSPIPMSHRKIYFEPSTRNQGNNNIQIVPTRHAMQAMMHV